MEIEHYLNFKWTRWADTVLSSIHIPEETSPVLKIPTGQPINCWVVDGMCKIKRKFNSLLAGDAGDLREGEFQQDLLLVVNHVDASPIHRNNHVILGKIWTLNKKAI